MKTYDVVKIDLVQNIGMALCLSAIKDLAKRSDSHPHLQNMFVFYFVREIEGIETKPQIEAKPQIYVKEIHWG